jgi:hypothetical protein
MTDRRVPIHGQSVTVSVNGTRRGEGVVLLYPDKLTAVITGSVRGWIYLAVPVVYAAVSYVVFHAIGFGPIAVWFVAGWWVRQALDKRRAAAKAAAGGADVTVIPLEQVTSVQTRKPVKAAGWLGLRNMTVTAADGTKYTFSGMTGNWHNRLAGALTACGREVHTAAETITVLPWATLEDG